MQTEKGQSIEDASMQMIEDVIGTHQYNEKQWPIVRRREYCINLWISGSIY